MRAYVACVQCIIMVSLAGCAKPNVLISPIYPTSILATSVVRPTEANSPRITPTLPKPTSSLLPSPSLSPAKTPTYPPYTDVPYTIVFIREGNIWLSEIGGHGERQLTTEAIAYPVVAPYSISPDCGGIAYTTYNSQTLDAMVKEASVTGDFEKVITGQNDPFSEVGVKWLDATHIAFRVQEHLVHGYYDKSVWNDIDPFQHIVLDLATGIRTQVPKSLFLSQSPDNRYWLTCSGYPYANACAWVLHDLATKEQFPIAQTIAWGGFGGWSPDDRHILFYTYDHPEDATTQLVVIEAATRKVLMTTTNNKTVLAASWSPDGQTIAFTQCDAENPWKRKNCTLRLMDYNGGDLAVIPSNNVGEAIDLDWTPDGSRLVFTRGDEGSILWSIRVDGTDMRPVVSSGRDFQVFCKWRK